MDELKVDNPGINTGHSALPEVKSCPEEEYRTLMMTQMQIYKNHIGNLLKRYPGISSKADSLSQFFNSFGVFFRKIYCGFSCQLRQRCLVRRQSCFNIQNTYTFEDLDSFPQDMSFGVTVKGCPHANKLNAIQLYMAKKFICVTGKEYYYRCTDIRENDKNRAIGRFLSVYGKILQEMFCSAVCPSNIHCKKEYIYCPQQYA